MAPMDFLGGVNRLLHRHSGPVPETRPSAASRLPDWCAKGARLQYISKSRGDVHIVEVEKIEDRQQAVLIRFEQDRRTWKRVPFREVSVICDGTLRPLWKRTGTQPAATVPEKPDNFEEEVPDSEDEANMAQPVDPEEAFEGPDPAPSDGEADRGAAAGAGQPLEAREATGEAAAAASPCGLELAAPEAEADSRQAPREEQPQALRQSSPGHAGSSSAEAPDSPAVALQSPRQPVEEPVASPEPEQEDEEEDDDDGAEAVDFAAVLRSPSAKRAPSSPFLASAAEADAEDFPAVLCSPSAGRATGSPPAGTSRAAGPDDAQTAAVSSVADVADATSPSSRFARATGADGTESEAAEAARSRPLEAAVEECAVVAVVQASSPAAARGGSAAAAPLPEVPRRSPAGGGSGTAPPPETPPRTRDPPRARDPPRPSRSASPSEEVVAVEVTTVEANAGESPRATTSPRESSAATAAQGGGQTVASRPRLTRRARMPAPPPPDVEGPILVDDPAQEPAPEPLRPSPKAALIARAAAKTVFEDEILAVAASTDPYLDHAGPKAGAAELPRRALTRKAPAEGDSPRKKRRKAAPAAPGAAEPRRRLGDGPASRGGGPASRVAAAAPPAPAPVDPARVVRLLPEVPASLLELPEVQVVASSPPKSKGGRAAANPPEAQAAVGSPLRAHGQEEVVRASLPFDPANADEVRIDRGDQVQILERHASGWIYCKNLASASGAGSTGWAPAWVVSDSKRARGRRRRKKARLEGG